MLYFFQYFSASVFHSFNASILQCFRVPLFQFFVVQCFRFPLFQCFHTSILSLPTISMLPYFSASLSHSFNVSVLKYFPFPLFQCFCTSVLPCSNLLVLPFSISISSFILIQSSSIYKFVYLYFNIFNGTVYQIVYVIILQDKIQYLILLIRY